MEYWTMVKIIVCFSGDVSRFLNAFFKNNDCNHDKNSHVNAVSKSDMKVANEN